MKEKNFIEKNIDMPLISSRDFPLISDNPEMLRVQVHKWVEKGTLIQLKRGLYLLNVPGIKKPPDFYIANKIVFPSYVSMESALSYHELIPEAVYSTVSVTTKKTNNFNNKSGNFVYHHIKRELFRDYQKREIEGFHVNIACPEKSVADYLYFKYINVENFKEVRFQNIDILDMKKLNKVIRGYPERVKEIARTIYERVH
jgi:predicted transcriptional regulator of viral defense system